MVEPSTARHEAHRGDSGFAEANAGLQPAAVLKPDRDNDTSVIRGPAIRKAGWLNSNGAVKHTAACEKYSSLSMAIFTQENLTLNITMKVICTAKTTKWNFGFR